MKQHVRVSVIIPAWNEAKHIADCLKSVATQTLQPDEVIVVDNMSTDTTAAVAASFSFVTLLHQTAEQGLIATRNMGFAHASGDILVRLDADIVLDPDWVKRAVADFQNDARLGGVTGLDVGHVLEYAPWRSTLWSRMYFLGSTATFRMPVLWGANMAIRRQAWEQVRPHAAQRDVDVHEDLDLSLLLASYGWKTRQDGGLRIQKDGREYHKWPKLWAYKKRRTLTKQRHLKMGSFNRPGALFYPQWHTWLWWTFVLAIPGSIFFGTSYVAYSLKRFARLFGIHISYD
ncbi:MAG TPA: glycosyltransferase family 2 protein [Candidatus Saccharimonadales bacterium]|nr:glycosyltransferase family 2 protein [Candidatus Saccharimonadales bacterium]